MDSKAQRLFVALGLAVGSMAWDIGQARACMRAVEAPIEAPQQDPPHAVANAEAAVEKGDARGAATALTSIYSNLKSAPDRLPEADPLERRAVRIMALASARSGGAVGLASGAGSKEANLDWSVSALRKLNAWRPTDASLQADLGEALAQTTSGRKEALDILSKLAANDVLGSAFGYAALAKLQAAAGDTAKSAEATKRCEAMTTSKNVCHPTAPPAPPAKKPRPSPLRVSRA